MKKNKPDVECQSPLGGACGHGCDLHCLFKTARNIQNLLEMAGSKYGNIRHHLVAEGELIYRRNDTLDYIVIVHSGLVKLEEVLEEGGERIFYLAGTGHVIGVSALIAEPMRHNAVAVQETQICKVPVASLNSLYYEQPELCLNLMHCWQLNLDLVDRCLLKFNTGNSTLRLANLLVFLINQQVNEKTTPTVRLLSLADMAALLGVSRETTCRDLAKLKSNGLIKKLTRNEFFYDYEKLQSLANLFISRC